MSNIPLTEIAQKVSRASCRLASIILPTRLQQLTCCCILFAACFVAIAGAQSLPFVNVSSRADVLTGQNVAIAGFIINSTATTTKQVLIRGLGPSLGLSGSLTNPTLTLNGPNGLIYSNNNWKDSQQSAISATGLQPSNDLESAIIWTLAPGTYTATLAGNNGGTGIGLIEVYDISGSAPLVNVSTRARVGILDNVLIGGVIVQDGTRAVIRALGPSLTGVSGTLQNPKLDFYNASGTLVASNDNWASGSAHSEIQQLGLAPTNPNESALLLTLGASNYTAIVSGVNSTTGVGSVEYYALADVGYPSIFLAWSNADNLNEPATTTAARHDLMWASDYKFGWNWVNSNNVVDGNYRDETIHKTLASPVYPIQTLRSLNPNMKIVCEVRHSDVPGDSLPVDDPWWERDSNGARVPSDFPGFYYLDETNTGLQTHVANRAAALMQTGQFDGVMLDRASRIQNTSLLSLLTKVRNAIGANGLIIINTNKNQFTTDKLGLVNGTFMESGVISTSADWKAARAALDWNEKYTRTPRFNCLEAAYINSRNDLNLMRAVTCLSLTHSNGLALFDDPNSLSTPDHLHNWYGFWSDHKLGNPTGPYYKYPNSTTGPADRRDFKNGSAIYNEQGNSAITVTFSEMRTNLATGVRGTTFTLNGNDGGIYLY